MQFQDWKFKFHKKISTAQFICLRSQFKIQQEALNCNFILTSFISYAATAKIRN